MIITNYEVKVGRWAVFMGLMKFNLRLEIFQRPSYHKTLPIAKASPFRNRHVETNGALDSIKLTLLGYLLVSLRVVI